MLKSTMALLTDECKSEPQDKGAWKQHLGNWGAFAAATGAALAMSTNASASIISGTPGLTVSDSGQRSATFTIGGASAILIDSNNSGGDRARSTFALLAPAKGIGSHLKFRAVSSGFTSFADRYVLGQPILAAGQASHFAVLWAKGTGEHSDPVGNFGPRESKGFVGFSNAAGDLGWLQVQVTLDDGSFPTQLELISWAYNDVAGAPINAGQTTEGSTTPEPGTAGLALLALGAAGILALRKRRNQLAAK